MDIAVLEGVQLPVDRWNGDSSSFSTWTELRVFVRGMNSGSVALPGELVPVLAEALGVRPLGGPGRND